MKIVLAPDGFKGSLSATEVCEAMAKGVKRVCQSAIIERIPLADGGEGTLAALLEGVGGTKRALRVRGPLEQNNVEALWGLLPDGRAVIEMAQASGLTKIEVSPLHALAASSFGTGQLLKTALDVGCRELVIGVGGSASTDGGVGALSALGIRFRDARGRALLPGGGSLHSLESIDTRFFDERIAKTRITVLCDVTNPLYGEQGAAQVYAPQKGATPAGVELLDGGLRQLAKVTHQLIQRDFSDCPGAGAAGGIAFGLMAFCNATLRSGIEFLLEATEFSQRIRDADLILTGEGSLDEQTMSGKAIKGICQAARKHNVPVIAFGGAVRLSGAQMDAIGLQSAFSLANAPLSLDHCINRAPELLADSVERALRITHIANPKNVVRYKTGEPRA